MKCANASIALTHLVTRSTCVALLALACAMPAGAQDTPVPVATAAKQDLKEVAPLNVPNAAPLANSAEDMDLDLAAPKAEPSPFAAMPANGAVAPTAARPAMGGTPGAGSTPVGANIPSAVTDVVTDLKRAEKNVTLEDVARAQDALARLDLLLDIEKKINEIEKVRDERKSIGKSMSRDSASGGFGQIPASALNLPTTPFRPTIPAVAAPAKPVVSTPAPARASSDGYTVDQITGSNGRYSAVISDSGGKKNTVAVGEKLNGFTVSNISATGVTLTNDKDRKVLTVKNEGVPMVVRPR